MSTPFSWNGVLNLPPDTGQPIQSIEFGGSAQFDGRATAVLKLTGSGTHSVCFGTVAAGAKGILVEVDADSTGLLSPVNIQVNGGGAPGQMEVSPGGFWAYFNPSPVAGITSMDIVYTSDATVRVWILGA